MTSGSRYETATTAYLLPTDLAKRPLMRRLFEAGV